MVSASAYSAFDKNTHTAVNVAVYLTEHPSQNVGTQNAVQQKTAPQDHNHTF